MISREILLHETWTAITMTKFVVFAAVTTFRPITSVHLLEKFFNTNLVYSI
jgi:hypothetical protein